MDAVVVGSGPNGLAGALTLAQAGLSVTVIEADNVAGGGARTSETTLPGYLHDECSAVHPQALASPYFRSIGLDQMVEFIVPPVSYAHPFDDKPSALLVPDVRQTAITLPSVDRRRWQDIFARLYRHLDGVTDITMHPIIRRANISSTALTFGMEVLRNNLHVPALGLSSQEARALILGSAVHLSTNPISLAASAGGLALTLQGQSFGWPIPVGGSQSIVDALLYKLIGAGATIHTGQHVRDIRELGKPDIVLLDVGMNQLPRLIPDLPKWYLRRARGYRYGPGTMKVDYALSEPVPWTDKEIARAGTLHLGGSPREILHSEREVLAGRMPETPFVLASQPSLFDSSRAPKGKHTLWAYCHTPANWSDAKSAELVDAQIERFAPGFRDVVLARTVRTAAALELKNPNCVGGDFTGGMPNLNQLIARPTPLVPWRTPARGVYLCSASAAPGPAVHGMAGHLAANQALKDLHIPSERK